MGKFEQYLQEELNGKKLGNLIDHYLDITSSGHEFGSWHEDALNELFGKLSPEDKKELGQAIMDMAEDDDDWSWRMGEKAFLRKVSGIQKRAK